MPSRQALSIGLPIVFLLLGIIGWFIAQMQASLAAGTLPWYGWVICYHGLSLALGLPTLYLAMASSQFSRLSWLWDPVVGVPPSRSNQPILLSQAIPLMLPASQIVIQQAGAGTAADLVSTLLGDAYQTAAPADATQVGRRAQQATGAALDGQSGPASISMFDAGRAMADQGEEYEASEEEEGDDGYAALPWRDLETLNQSLANLLGRMYPSRVPSAGSSETELSDFLTAMHGAVSQLGVGLNDLQASLVSSTGDYEPQPNDAMLMATALEQASRTFRGVAAVLRATSAEAAASDLAL